MAFIFYDVLIDRSLFIMPSKRVVQLFQELSFEKKLLGIGSFILVLSLFLPWYQDLDSFKTGDVFLGITGPLYLAGFSLLAMGLGNLIFMYMEINGKKMPFMNMKFSTFYFISGIFAFFMLLLVNSVYFHAKFGINITLKQSQFGMFFAFIASSFITIGGYLSSRDKATLLKEFQEEVEQDAFIHLPKQEKSVQNIRKTEPAHQNPAEVQQHVQQEAQKLDKPAHPISQPEKSKPQSYRIDL